MAEKTYSFQIKQGDLVTRKGNVDDVFQVSRGIYTARFMEAQDYEMEAHGMGEYAGVYASAIDVVVMSGPYMGTVRKKRRANNYLPIPGAVAHVS